MGHLKFRIKDFAFARDYPPRAFRHQFFHALRIGFEPCQSHVARVVKDPHAVRAVARIGRDMPPNGDFKGRNVAFARPCDGWAVGSINQTTWRGED